MEKEIKVFSENFGVTFKNRLLSVFFKNGCSSKETIVRFINKTDFAKYKDISIIGYLEIPPVPYYIENSDSYDYGYNDDTNIVRYEFDDFERGVITLEPRSKYEIYSDFRGHMYVVIC